MQDIPAPPALPQPATEGVPEAPNMPPSLIAATHSIGGGMKPAPRNKADLDRVLNRTKQAHQAQSKL